MMVAVMAPGLSDGSCGWPQADVQMRGEVLDGVPFLNWTIRGLIAPLGKPFHL